MSCCGAGISTGEGGGTPGPPGPTGPAGPTFRIVWRSDGTGTATTWDDVMAIIADTDGPCIIFVDQIDDILTIPETSGDPSIATTYDVKGSTFEFPLWGPNDPRSTVYVEDGVVLHNMFGGEGVGTLIFQNSVLFALTYTSRPHLAIGNGITLNNSGSVGLIDLQDADADSTHTFYGGVTLVGLILDGSGGGPSTNVNLYSQGPVTWDTDSMLGVNMNLFHDGQCFPIPSWTDSTWGNNTEGSDGGTGPTANRPAGALLRSGCQYFDTDLNKQLTYDGTNWNDAGTTMMDCCTGDALMGGGDSFFLRTTGGAPIEIDFPYWNIGDILDAQCDATVEAQNPAGNLIGLVRLMVSLDSGATWKILRPSGSQFRSAAGNDNRYAAASRMALTVNQTTPPRVRVGIFVPAGTLSVDFTGDATGCTLTAKRCPPGTWSGTPPGVLV